MNILQVMQTVDKAWRNVAKTTIVNCFRSCVFLLGAAEDDTSIFIIENTVTDRE